MTLSGADPCSTLGLGGGIIPQFNVFSEFLKFGGDIQVLPIFKIITIFKIWGYIQVLTKIYLNNLKHVLLLESIKTINYVFTMYMFTNDNS